MQRQQVDVLVVSQEPLSPPRQPQGSSAMTSLPHNATNDTAPQSSQPVHRGPPSSASFVLFFWLPHTSCNTPALLLLLQEMLCKSRRPSTPARPNSTRPI